MDKGLVLSENPMFEIFFPDSMRGMEWIKPDLYSWTWEARPPLFNEYEF